MISSKGMLLFSSVEQVKIIKLKWGPWTELKSKYTLKSLLCHNMMYVTLLPNSGSKLCTMTSIPTCSTELKSSPPF